jgi:hypothetical protein
MVGCGMASQDAISNAVGCAKFYSRSHDAVIRVYDAMRIRSLPSIPELLKRLKRFALEYACLTASSYLENSHIFKMWRAQKVDNPVLSLILCPQT